MALMEYAYEEILYPEFTLEFPDLLAETPHKYNFFSERHLQAVWLEQKYFKELKTADGLPVTVISPGIWNSEAGPDFLKAHLRIGNQELRGDVEIHLQDEGWVHHKHHLDPRYDNVIFHLSLWNPKNDKPILTSSGRQAYNGHLEHFLTIPLAKIERLIDLDLYPYKKFVGSGRCAQALYRDLPNEEIIAFFKAAADWRLVQKESTLVVMQETPNGQFATGIAQALGYKNNAKQFLEIFNNLFPLRHLGERPLLALALGSCAFFDASYRKRWQASPYYQQLLEHWEELAPRQHARILLNLNQIRPHNHPIRRLAYLAKLLSDPLFDSLYATIVGGWETSWQEAQNNRSWSQLHRTLVQLIPSYTDLHWNHHYNFELKSRQASLSLIGDDFKNLVLVNTLLPLIRKRVEQREIAEEKRGL